MKIFYYLILLVLFSSCDAVVVRGKTEENIQKAVEEAYFEGQKDAIEGDVRISKNNDSCWMWTKSCWDSGKEPIYNPSLVCDGAIKTEE